MSTENTHIQKTIINFSSFIVNTGMIWDTGPSWEERTLIPMFMYGIEKNFCSCKGKSALLKNTKQILMILNSPKTIHPHLNF